MNGASFLLIFVLLVAMAAGMFFLVDQLNRNAVEILENRTTIQNLQAGLQAARSEQVRQQQLLETQQAALNQKNGELDAARQALTSAQAGVAGLQNRLTAEQQARAAVEQQNAALRAELAAAQNRLAAAAAAAAAAAPAPTPAPVQAFTALPGASRTADFPWTVPAGGLMLAGGALAWNRRAQHHSLPAQTAGVVAVSMTRAQAHQYAHFLRAQQGGTASGKKS